MADQKALSIENLQAAMLENNTKMKAWVNDQLSKISTFNIEWVESLPTEDISTNTIYMLKNESSTKEKHGGTDTSPNWRKTFKNTEEVILLNSLKECRASPLLFRKRK